MIVLSGSRLLSVLLGLSMVGLATVGAQGVTLVAAGAAVLAVGLATIFRPAATVAVLMTLLVIVASDPSHVLAAMSGLCAAGYLVCRYADGAVVAGGGPTTVAAVGFTFAGLVATSFPLQVPWLPLAAPLAVLAIYVLVTRPFVN